MGKTSARLGTSSPMMSESGCTNRIRRERKELKSGQIARFSTIESKLIHPLVRTAEIIQHEATRMSKTTNPKTTDLKVDAKNEAQRQILTNIFPVEKIPKELRKPTIGRRCQRAAGPTKRG